MKIGFIGLGRMGRGVCENFVRHGHDVAVYDVSAAAMEHFRGQAELSPDPAALFQRSEAVLLSLPSSVQVEDMCETFFACGVEGKTVIDLSTSYPLSTKKLHAAFKERGGVLLDAPLMGNPTMAAEGTISVTVGGDEADFEAARPIFEAFTSRAD